MADGQQDPHRRTGRRDLLWLVHRGEGEGDTGAPRLTTRRRAVRWAALGLSAVVLLTAAAGAFVYFRLNANIRDLPLFGGVGGDAGTERPDAFGRTPVNVLVIGSDMRADPADCAIGGDCGPGRHADVQMVLHISADRSHAGVLSIPRDIVTDLPACRAPKGGIAAARRGPINATLRYGPGCTVAAVHTLTRIPIDHFVMADFAGVVRMSDAVGGVPVCVDRNVYDPYSQLRLTAGRHALHGQGALAFLRSRHAFGDGSDLGRTDTQHLFLASLAQRMQQGGSLTGPAGLLSLGDAATRALTVDPGLAGIAELSGLASDVRKVPSARFAFTTMPTRPDPLDADRLVAGAASDRLFAGIAADRPLTVSGAPPAAGPPMAAAGRPAAGPPRDETFEDAPQSPAQDVPGQFSSGQDAAVRGRTTADAVACASVARAATVRLRGVMLTPTAAFAASRRVPLSAP